MDIEIRYFEDCPNWRAVVALVEASIEQLGLDATVTLTEVDTFEKAQRLSFIGSPSIFIDGVDPWGDAGGPVGLGCRIYRNAAGLAGSPTPDQMRAAIASAVTP